MRAKDMLKYNVADIVAQEISDDVLMVIAFHWQANDNRPGNCWSVAAEGKPHQREAVFIGDIEEDIVHRCTA
jgi:hypothetical protein